MFHFLHLTKTFPKGSQVILRQHLVVNVIISNLPWDSKLVTFLKVFGMAELEGVRFFVTHFKCLDMLIDFQTNLFYCYDDSALFFQIKIVKAKPNNLISILCQPFNSITKSYSAS